jgi:chemotaxis protein methyltransferase CheR
MNSSLSDSNYKEICETVYEYSRINLGEGKKDLVTARLNKRLRLLGLENYTDYCNYLKSSNGEEELIQLIDAISTNHTFFFREYKHFEFLKEVALPQLMDKINKSSEKSFKIWSAASSSGEEPYSLAIFLNEYFEKFPDLQWHVDATDISTKVLGLAQRAIYSEDRVKEVPMDLMKKYFQKGINRFEGHFRLKNFIIDKVKFQRINLLQPNYPFSEQFHVILCRNVMIYFDKETQEALVQKLTAQLAPGGYLLIGHSESLTNIKHNLKALQPAVYQKVG